MSLLNSLFSGVSGLRNHQSMMDVVGNNIANVNSIGYKGSRVTFSDTFNNFVRFGSNPTSTSGGTNAFQIGLGMKINSIDRNWNQGTFERTGITTDLALQGDGLFVLKSNGETFFSRAGNFTFDADGKLVNPQTGSVVQGKLATDDGIIPPGNNLEDVVIDSNLKLPAVATTKTEWGGNLDSTETLTRSENYVESGNLNANMGVGDIFEDQNTVYDFNGNAYTMKITYTKSAADTFDVSYELVDDTDTSVIGPNTATVKFADSADVALAASETPPRTLLVGDVYQIDGATAAPIKIEDIDLGIDLNLDLVNITQQSSTTTLSSTVDDNREATIVNGTVTVYDSLGNPHNLDIRFTKTAPNSWNWSVNMAASSGTLSSNSGTMVFNSDGSINAISPNPPMVAFAPTGGASLQNIELDFGAKFDGITQTSSNSVISALNQNGAASATLSNLSIDQYGHVVGVFSNGQSKKLAQIMLATFPNLNGLTSIGDNMFTISANAGDPLIGDPGEATRTTIQSGALEQSNVDLSEEFTRMIVAQRGFQANARVVTTSDNLLQEITNLVR